MTARPPRPPVYVLGRFPPPSDGQTLATERCASFLDGAFDVDRVNTQFTGADPLEVHPQFDLERTLFYVRLRRRVAAALRRRPAAPVLWHAISPAPLGHLRDVLTAAPAFAPGQPVAAVLHRAGFDRLIQKPLVARSAARLVRRVDAFVFQSTALADRCADVVPTAKRRVIPNTIRDETASPADVVVRKQERGPGRPLHVLFLSNMLPEKGYLDVLEAVGSLHKEGIEVRATFAGRWPDADAQAAFEARSRDLGVGPLIDVPGPIADPRAVRRLHLEADVFALPTSHPTETQPIAILEALAAGTPVVTVDRAVLRDMITDGVEGALVPAHSPSAIADAVARLTAPDVWRARSRAARARFDAAFSPAVVGDLWRALATDLGAEPV